MALIVRGLLGGLLQTLFLGLLLLGPVQLLQADLKWFQGWLYLALHFLMIEGAVVFLGLWAPASLAKRLEPPFSARQPARDQVVTGILFAVICLWFVGVPCDVFLLQVFSPPALWVVAGGGLLFFLGFGIMIWAIYQNAFAAPIVKDQTEQGQVVVDTGLYGWVRHPFYTGLIFFFIGSGLFLGSLLSVILSLAIVFVLLARVRVEEEFLNEKLPGYRNYCQRVRSRFLPGIF